MSLIDYITRIPINPARPAAIITIPTLCIRANSTGKTKHRWLCNTHIAITNMILRPKFQKAIDLTQNTLVFLNDMLVVITGKKSDPNQHQKLYEISLLQKTSLYPGSNVTLCLIKQKGWSSNLRKKSTRSSIKKNRSDRKIKNSFILFKQP